MENFETENRVLRHFHHFRHFRRFRRFRHFRHFHHFRHFRHFHQNRNLRPNTSEIAFFVILILKFFKIVISDLVLRKVDLKI